MLASVAVVARLPRALEVEEEHPRLALAVEEEHPNLALVEVAERRCWALEAVAAVRQLGSPSVVQDWWVLSHSHCQLQIGVAGAPWYRRE